MNTTSNQPLITTSSSSSSPPSWDVFFSFYGRDTRRSFVANLYFALDQAGISAFRGDPALEKGQGISSGLLNAIKDTNMFVVVVSENYVRSSWCLNELVEILASKKTVNQVIPVFYYVDPSDLRHQKGCFGEALELHKQRYSVNVIDKWKSALAEISEISGYLLRKEEANQDESELVQDIVSRVASHPSIKQLHREEYLYGIDLAVEEIYHVSDNESDIVQAIVSHVASLASIKQLHREEYLYGIDLAVEEIYQKLRMEELNDVRVIGICGMAGIGKTTTAKAFYNRYSNRFDISCFIEDVKQYSQGGSPQLPLLQQLLSELLRRRDYMVPDVKTGIRQLQYVLQSKKALIILDDLNKSSHLEWLFRLSFSAGSRLVITTRDVNVLNGLKVYVSELDIYMVKKLEHKDSLELFSYHAFEQSMPPDDFKGYSLSFVTYAKGLPLALKVLGASLCDRGYKTISWEYMYIKVLHIPENEIHKILRLSYDELADYDAKAMFLDIVLFFIGKKKGEAIDILESCDFFPKVGIPMLENQLLISKGDRFEMHNLIEEMGREVIREHCKDGYRRLLHLCQRNAYEALEYFKGTNEVEGLVLETTKWPDQQLTTDIFEKMPNLKLLKIIGAPHIQGSFVNCFHELRYISWHHCPWTQLPSDFHPPKLVAFDMQYSKLERFWKDVTFLRTEVQIDFPQREFTLVDIEEFLGLMEKASEYEVRKSKLVAVRNLQVMHIQNLSLSDIPDNLSFPDLEILILKSNPDLTSIPSAFCERMPALEVLDMSNTSIKFLPPSVSKLKKLSELLLRRCELLMELPHEIGELVNLKVLDLEGTDLVCLPKELQNMIDLKCLKVSLYDAESYRNSKKIVDIIPEKALSKLTQLDELSIDVDPQDIWCDAAVRVIIKDLPGLRNLKTLKIYLPNTVLLQDLLELKWNNTELSIYQTLENFNIVIGPNAQHFITRLPRDLEEEFLKLKKCLKYINGEGSTAKFAEALKHANALYIDRHWTIQTLSVFRLEELKELKYCLLVDCNKMHTVFDESDFDHGVADKADTFLSLQYLAIHYLKDLEVIWKGPSIGCCVRSLKALTIHMCPNLNTIFTKVLLGDLVNLKEIIVEDCPKIKTLIAEDESQFTSEEILPGLKKLSLFYLPELESISSSVSIGPKLENLVIYDCPKLKKLPSMEWWNEEDIIKIKGESEWWDSLEWNEQAEGRSDQPKYRGHVFSELDEAFLDDLAPEYGNSLRLLVKDCNTD